MNRLIFIFGDQLDHAISSLKDINKSKDVIMLCEVQEETVYVKHHPKKIAFLFSAMRHFTTELSSQGYQVRYIKLDDPTNSGSFMSEIQRAKTELRFNKIVMTKPGEWRVLEAIKEWQKKNSILVELREDDRFLCGIDEFSQWAHGRKQLRMEFFYREMRKKYKILLEKNGEPTGGAWNYDKENRAPAKTTISPLRRLSHKKDAITHEVINLVNACFSDHFGTLEPFHFAVTREQALAEARQFMECFLPDFGRYQDVMMSNQPYMFHSLLSCYLNAGLLRPLELCQMAEKQYKNKKASLAAVEGYIRQILGWREFMRGIYWRFMPKYRELNYLNAKNALPALFWGASTNMFCLAEAVKHTKEHAYSHHIQRLMITGNFALIAGLDPKAVQEWYLAVYADAYEWVELPNTLGMALFGDGGIVASKPYAASAKYIDKMSNFCKKCYYDPKLSSGEKACPFNSLYWDFYARHESKLENNPRIPFVYKTWHTFDKSKQRDILKQAKLYLSKMKEDAL